MLGLDSMLLKYMNLVSKLCKVLVSTQDQLVVPRKHYISNSLHRFSTFCEGECIPGFRKHRIDSMDVNTRTPKEATLLTFCSLSRHTTGKVMFFLKGTVRNISEINAGYRYYWFQMNVQEYLALYVWEIKQDMWKRETTWIFSCHRYIFQQLTFIRGHSASQKVIDTAISSQFRQYSLMLTVLESWKKSLSYSFRRNELWMWIQ